MPKRPSRVVQGILAMVETEWADCTQIDAMLASARGRGSDRKFRLFAVACLSRVSYLLCHPDVLRALEAAERFADGAATGEGLRAAAELAMWAGDDSSWHSLESASGSWAAAAACYAKDFAAAQGVVHEVRRAHAEDDVQRGLEELAQCDLLRDIFGNPFRPPPAISPSILAWNDGIVPRLAAGIYESREFTPTSLGVLADALEEAACGDAEVLSHLRGPGPHVRGCWVVDVLLGKE
jgi:hypothetical protein